MIDIFQIISTITNPRMILVFAPWSFIFGVIGCFFRLIFRGNKKGPIATIPDIGASVLGFIYTGLLPSFLILLRHMGFVYAIVAIVSTAFCDVGAYYGGKLFGKTALKPEISAKKTFEGAISGFITSMIAAIILVYFNKDSFGNNLFHGVMIGIFAGIFSQFSHGGILDRIDSYIFVVWAIYFYIDWFVLHNFTF